MKRQKAMPRPNEPRGTDFRTALSADDAKLVKQAIWNGETQANVAAHFNISQGTVHRMVKGRAYHEFPWPDGTYGALPVERLHRKKERKPDDLHLPDAAASDSPIGTVIDDAIDKYFQTDNETTRQRAIEDMAAQADAVLEDFILEDIKEIDPTPRKPKPAPAPAELNDQDMLSWAEIKANASTNPAVVLAIQDQELRKLLQAVFAIIPKTEWHSERAEKMITDLAVTLGVKLKYASLGLGMSHRKPGRKKGSHTR
jgi:hypothetical protein